MTSLQLKGRSMLCSDIASPVLRYLTAFFSNLGGPDHLPGKGSSASCAVDEAKRQHISGLIEASLYVHAVGECPQLQRMELHGACSGVLSPIKCSLVGELTSLTRLQHLELEECVLPACLPPWLLFCAWSWSGLQPLLGMCQNAVLVLSLAVRFSPPLRWAQVSEGGWLLRAAAVRGPAVHRPASKEAAGATLLCGGLFKAHGADHRAPQSV